MKKLIALLLAMVMLMGMLAGCGKKTDKKTGKDKDESSRPETTGSTGETAGQKEENSGAIENDGTATAVTGTGRKISAATINYYFVDSMRNMYAQYKGYFGSEAATYISLYMGVDISKPLNEQSYDSSGTTMADSFLETILENIIVNLALCDRAKVEGYRLPEADEAAIANSISMLQQYAAAGGYATVDAYLKAQYGNDANTASYTAYVRESTLANSYYNAYANSLTFTEEQIRARDDGSYDDYPNNQHLANVRHLLVEFEGGITNPMGGIYYTDEDKAVAKTEAERLLQLWKDGAATEESFTALVTEHTDDPGSKKTGGLYENIHPESPYVEAFLNWSIDPVRKVGDIDIVETEYGYHIMYFSGYGTLTIREYMIFEDLTTEALENWYTELSESDTITLTNDTGLRLDLVIDTLD